MTSLHRLFPVRYRLRLLFAVTALVALALAWFSHNLRQTKAQQRAILALERFDAWYQYDYEKNIEGVRDPIPPGPAFLRELFGIDFVSNIVSVSFRKPPSSENRIKPTDDDIEFLVTHLPNLEAISIGRSQITDRGLRHISRLKRVKHVLLGSCHATEEGIRRLRSRHPEIRITYLSDWEPAKKGRPEA